MTSEIVLVMGFPAAGKSTLVEQYVNEGYTRFNRDVTGGTIAGIAKKVDEYLLAIAIGHRKLVLDNLYPSVESRKSIIAVAKKHNSIIRCVHLTTSMEEAMMNACLRMMRKHDHIPDPKFFSTLDDPNTFPVAVIYKYRKEFQKPSVSEGFLSVMEVPFTRKWGPDYINKALFLDYDGTLRLSMGKQKYPIRKEDIKILPGRAEVIQAFKDRGYYVFGVSNQSGVAKGNITFAECKQRFIDTNTMLGEGLIDSFSFCPHKVPPISCYCRKPNCGIGAFYIAKYKLRPSECIMVGDMGSDKTFAARCGFKYADVNQFFHS